MTVIDIKIDGKTFDNFKRRDKTRLIFVKGNMRALCRIKRGAQVKGSEINLLIEVFIERGRKQGGEGGWDGVKNRGIT